MTIIGISGGPNSITQRYLELPNESFHDSSASVIRDGHVIAAYEEERFTRIKHTNLFPARSIKECLKHLGEAEPDYFAFSIGDDFLYSQITSDKTKSHLYPDATAFISEILYHHCQLKVGKDKIRFYDHHFSHAAAAYFQSGLPKSLVITIDGSGDGFAGKIYEVKHGKFRLLRTIAVADSLGFYYLHVTRHLGFSLFDEYKVMGLAPYGDPGVYREIFAEFYRLLPEGRYRINQDALYKLRTIARMRKSDGEITQTHKDIAAALQESLEAIVFHIVRYFAAETGNRNLCLSGGVALNCKMTGELLYSGIFENIFSHPASADNGLSIGAALACYHELTNENIAYPLRHLYLGSSYTDADVVEEVKKWDRQVKAEERGNVPLAAASLIADQRVIGWFQGRAEFGPRALGNRSILADPRPFENREKLNRIIKMREGFRPFAPSVLEEMVEEYFEVPGNARMFPFMTVILKVKPKYRSVLRAVTHVDGTARVQTVSKNVNEPYWELIRQFYALTGVGMVLNTSFNSNVEPIVNSPKEALICFLTSELDNLVMGPSIVSKRAGVFYASPEYILRLPDHVVLWGERNEATFLKNLYTNLDFRISPALCRVIKEEKKVQQTDVLLFDEIKQLMQLRIVDPVY